MRQREATAQNSEPAKSSAWWNLVTVLAVVLAVAGLGALALLVTLRLTGNQTWNGLNWLVMFALPASFILMLLAVLRSIRRRRRL
ncbi:hypothetical protein RSal33209_0493 [Renibacterium salmoninarum ATCC 33209]|uniref:Uncharacterized protein n=1 Tax=Renibacterium salmoninarum (strain ATCC 33209 / DSM 20767 / JCM 11484 / NBRC 15589 / NCIMB 2235) TaxID=288705 RepID=A9WMB1_RENSM|nr:hypothetical protein [Renibacterium salmoninarum]ABY22243.1 hypothetical protein RSal33209_0493 [Renibacterium salmoninarum ATCC 33209]